MEIWNNKLVKLPRFCHDMLPGCWQKKKMTLAMAVIGCVAAVGGKINDGSFAVVCVRKNRNIHATAIFP